jgi:cytochrome c2
MREAWRFLTAAFLLPLLMATETARAADVPGKKIFVERKCNTCHALETEGIIKAKASDEAEEAGEESSGDEPPDLSGVGRRFDAGQMDGWLRKKLAIDGDKHPKRFAGGDEERKVLIEWLLKTQPATKTEPAAAPKK